jgi:hypothetical protein
VLTPQHLLDRCLDLGGPIAVGDDTRTALINLAAVDGDLDLRQHQAGDEAEKRVGNMLRMIASTREFQLA